MKRNNNCDPLPNTRNLSDFLAQVVTNTPDKDKAGSTSKKFKTTPQLLHLGSNLKVEKRNKRLSSANITSRFRNDSLTTTINNRSFFDEVSPQSKLQIKPETSNYNTPNETELKIDEGTIQLNEPPNELFPVPIKSENTNRSFTEYINRVNTSFISCPLQASGDSLGNWIKTVTTTPSLNDSTESDPYTRKRKKKLVSDGFAEYIRILSPRLASDVHMWYYSVKQGTHLKGIDRNEIITACIETVHIHGTLYNTTCSVIDPIPDKIAENEYFQSCNRLTVVFTSQTVEMLRIRSNSCVKICPPWTFLLVGPLNSPVILCTYFSYLSDSSSFPKTKQFQTPLHNVPINLWRSTQHQEDVNHKTNNPHVTPYYDTDTEVQLLQHTLKTALKSQGWEYLTLTGAVIHVTHVLNPRELSDTQVTEMNLDQHFHIFLRDSNDIVSVISLPSPVLDKHSIQSYQLFNSIVLLKSIKVLSRVNKLTSPRVMSIVQTLTQNQKCCYMLSAGSYSELQILKANFPYTETNYLTKLTENIADEKSSRMSLVGRLQHTQLEVPLPTQDGDIEEHSRPLSGCYIFLLGVNSNLFQVYLEPVLTRLLRHTLQEASGRLFYLGSLFVSRITERPTRLYADQYSLLLEIENAGLILGSELLERVVDNFYCVTRVSYPLFDEDYRLGSMVCVRGNIVDVVEECAYMWQVCGVCGEGVEESSQMKGYYCDQCQKLITHPVNKYNLELIIKCNNIDNIQLIVRLHDDTVVKILPEVTDGKMYEKVELKGRKIEIECCYVLERRVLPSGLTKVYFIENKHFLNM